MFDLLIRNAQIIDGSGRARFVSDIGVSAGRIIEIGPMSGKSNVLYWLEKRGRGGDEQLANRILEAAKKSSRVLTDAEILSLCEKSAGN